MDFGWLRIKEKDMTKKQIQDDRINKWKHNNLVVMQDTFMSGWGEAEGGLSYAAWACTDEHLDQVLEWVESRSDSKNVSVQDKDYVPQFAAHFHIYEVNDGHPALCKN